MNRHSEVLSTSWRKVALPALAIMGGALLANVMAPSAVQAASREMAGYTCQSTNSCHFGEKECCSEYFGVCSTMCAIIVE